MKRICFLIVLIGLVSVLSYAQDNHPVASSAKISFDYCYKTFGDAIVVKTNAEPSVDHPYILNYMYGTEPLSQELTTSGEQKVVFTKANGCDHEVDVNLVVSSCPEGALNANAVFSISSTQKVYFSKGNLKYCPNPSEGPKTHKTKESDNAIGRFEFEEKQYEYSNSTPSGSSDTKWCGFLMPGSSGKKNTDPWRYESSSSYYKLGFSGTDSDYDWGVYNAIYNGGNEPGQWRVLTSTEWTYLLTDRGTSKRGTATVNGVKGLVILPDNWLVQPAGCPQWSNNVTKNMDNMVYDINQWKDMEDLGAVFLPAAGYVKESYSKENQKMGCYYTAIAGSRDYMQIALFGQYSYGSYGIKVRDQHNDGVECGYYHGGCSIRLVQDLPTDK